jgi:hypothetical protein
MTSAFSKINKQVNITTTHWENNISRPFQSEFIFLMIFTRCFMNTNNQVNWDSIHSFATLIDMAQFPLAWPIHYF